MSTTLFHHISSRKERYSVLLFLRLSGCTYHLIFGCMFPRVRHETNARMTGLVANRICGYHGDRSTGVYVWSDIEPDPFQSTNKLDYGIRLDATLDARPACLENLMLTSIPRSRTYTCGSRASRYFMSPFLMAFLSTAVGKYRRLFKISLGSVSAGGLVRRQAFFWSNYTGQNISQCHLVHRTPDLRIGVSRKHDGTDKPICSFA